MNALRQFVTASSDTLVINLPVEYQKKKLEIIILSADVETLDLKNTERLAQAHRNIDAGGGIENPADFLAEFEQNRQDRSLPFRDWYLCMRILDSNLIIYSALPEFTYLRPLLKDPESHASDFPHLEVLRFHRLDDKSKTFFESAFYSLTLLPITDPILEMAISLRQQRKMPAGDALIASTTLLYNFELYIRNVSDFDWIPNLTRTFRGIKSK